MLKRKFGIHALELRQYGFDYLQVSQLRYPMPAIRRPDVLGRLIGAVLAARHVHRRAGVDPLECRSDLLLNFDS